MKHCAQTGHMEAFSYEVVLLDGAHFLRFLSSFHFVQFIHMLSV